MDEALIYFASTILACTVASEITLCFMIIFFEWRKRRGKSNNR